jgi:hypothetical protein
MNGAIKEAVVVDSDAKSLPTVDEKKFEVTLTLTEKYWNDDVKRYLIDFGRNGSVMVSETPEVTIEIADLWRVTDALYSDQIKYVEIRRIN